MDPQTTLPVPVAVAAHTLKIPTFLYRFPVTVSKARIRLDSRKSVRSFKGIICVDISEFESYMPSHAVGSLWRVYPVHGLCEQRHSSPNGQGDPPKSWDEIAPGHVVIALDEPGEGWYETIVVETSGDMLTLRWRDYPRERRITRHRLSVGLLYAHGLPATDPNSRSPKSQSAKPKSLAKPASAEPATAFPKTWDDIDITASCSRKKTGRGGVGGRRSRPTDSGRSQ